MDVLGWIAAAAVIASIDVPRLLKNELRKELLVFSVIALTGLGMGIMRCLRMEFPSPIELIAAVYGPVSDAVLSIFK